MTNLTYIDNSNLSAFATLLPAELLPAIGDGTLTAVGALLLQNPVGAAVLEFEEHTCRLRSFYITSFGRRKGLGSDFMTKLVHNIRQLSGVYTISMTVPDDAGAGDFLTACGFVMEQQQSENVCLTLGDLQHAKHIADKPVRQLAQGKCVAYSQLSAAQRTQYERQLAKTDEYLPDRGIEDPAMLPNVSQFCVDGDQITSCLLLSQDEQGVCLEFVHTRSGGTAFLAMLSCAVEAMRHDFPPETQIRFEVVDEMTASLTEKIVPTATKTCRTVARMSL